MRDLDEPDRALFDLLAELAASRYDFVTTTPASHGRVLDRASKKAARDDRDVFGWSLPFAQGVLQPRIESALRASGMLETTAGGLYSRVRVSAVDGRLYLHSAYPTLADDAVFLGPDSYRFARLIAAELAHRPVPARSRIADIGVGAGVGILTAAAHCRAATLVATDVNVQALRLARINAAAASATLELIETSGLDGVPGLFDLALLNPPYIIDDGARAYRHGGGMHGGAVSLDLAASALGRLSSDGRLILYTGSAIVDGDDALRAALAHAADAHGCTMRYSEIDPDVFGDELSNPHYADVDRIALIAAIFTKHA